MKISTACLYGMKSSKFHIDLKFVHFTPIQRSFNQIIIKEDNSAFNEI